MSSKVYSSTGSLHKRSARSVLKQREKKNEKIAKCYDSELKGAESNFSQSSKSSLHKKLPTKFTLRPDLYKRLESKAKEIQMVSKGPSKNIENPESPEARSVQQRGSTLPEGKVEKLDASESVNLTHSNLQMKHLSKSSISLRRPNNEDSAKKLSEAKTNALSLINTLNTDITKKVMHESMHNVAISEAVSKNVEEKSSLSNYIKFLKNQIATQRAKKSKVCHKVNKVVKQSQGTNEQRSKKHKIMSELATSIERVLRECKFQQSKVPGLTQAESCVIEQVSKRLGEIDSLEKQVHTLKEAIMLQKWRLTETKALECKEQKLLSNFEKERQVELIVRDNLLSSVEKATQGSQV